MSEKNLIKDYMLKNELDIEEVMKNYTPYIYTILKNRNVNLTNEDIEENNFRCIFSSLEKSK